MVFVSDVGALARFDAMNYRAILPLVLLILSNQMLASSEKETNGQKTNCTQSSLPTADPNKNSSQAATPSDDMVSCGNEPTKDTGKTNNVHARRSMFSSTVLRLLDVASDLIGAVSIMAIITNSVLLLVILLDPLKKLRKSKTTVIIFSLALADLLTGWASACYMTTDGDVKAFRIIFDVLSVGFSVSLFTLLVFTLERCIATMYPLLIKQYVTFTKTYVVCFCAWIAGAIVGTNFFYYEPPPSITLEKMRIGRIVVLEIAVIAIVVLNICIIISVRRHSSRMMHCRSSSMGAQKKQRKMNAVLTSLVVLLFVTVVPHLVVTQLYHITRLSGPLTTSRKDIFLRVFPRLFVPFAFFNYVLNPIIYAWRLYDYRASFIALFKRRRNFYFRAGRQSRTQGKTTSSSLSQRTVGERQPETVRKGDDCKEVRI